MNTVADIRLRKLAQIRAIIRTGASESAACRIAGVPRSTFQNWMAAFEKHGFDGLKPAREKRWNRAEALHG